MMHSFGFTIQLALLGVF